MASRGGDREDRRDEAGSAGVGLQALHHREQHIDEPALTAGVESCQM